MKLRLSFLIFLLMTVACSGLPEVPEIFDSIDDIGSTNAPSVVPEPVDLQGFDAVVFDDIDIYYHLQTIDGLTDPLCLEGNRLAAEAFLEGAAFMDICANVTGQIWKLIETGDEGYYQLQTLFLEDQSKCLEGNQLSDEAFLQGTAFMDDCSGVSGQSWKFVEVEQGVYRMQTKFLEADNRCLEGNKLGFDAAFFGAAFMNSCRAVDQQLWIVVPIENPSVIAEAEQVETIDTLSAEAAVIGDTTVYYQLQAANGQCLDGASATDDANVLEAAYVTGCQGNATQLWQIIETDQAGYYRLQTQFTQDFFRCFDGDQPGAAAIFNGAAFLNDCTASKGQLWRFIDAGNGAYRLQPARLEGQNLCLHAPTSDAARMDTCQNGSDQVWQLIPTSAPARPQERVPYTAGT